MFTNFSSSTETFQVGYDCGKMIESAVHVLLNDSPQIWREQLINKCTCGVSLLAPVRILLLQSFSLNRQKKNA